MDAAALRQNRLVLAKGRVALRALAGDVVDLTRSLVRRSCFVLGTRGSCPGGPRPLAVGIQATLSN